MPHTGVEEKTPWRNVPASVKSETARLLGSPVARATRAWGGYGPTPTYRLRLHDGRRAFLKGINAESNDFMRQAFIRELRIYRELPDILDGYAPEFLGSFVVEDWSVLLLEDLGPRTAPPWSASLARQVVTELAVFHESTRGATLPAWLQTPGLAGSTEQNTWRCAFSVEEMAPSAALAGAKGGEAERWFQEHGSVLTEASRRLADPSFERTFIHRDVRSDNLRLVDGRLVLFDWPHASSAPPEFDMAAFAQAVKVEGGPDPQVVSEWYGARWTVDQDALDASVASLAGFFAVAARGPEIPGLPRLRSFVRAQLKVTLMWAADRFRLPEPTWVDEIQT
ncbi:MAG: phosphotransferase [Dehalococcoidia bacterium]|jgi:fructosamine-3-kinase|nr:phosphotransferase [Dehalococcoidia bacterium]